MKKAVFTLAILAAVVYAGWYFLPQPAQQYAAAFLGAVAWRDAGEIRNVLESMAAAPKVETRGQVLTKELRRNLVVLRRRSGSGTQFSQGSPPSEDGPLHVPDPEKATTAELLNSSEAIIKELEAIGGSESIGDKVVDRVLERLLPERNWSAECKVEQ